MPLLGELRYSTEEYVKLANKKHNNKFDYTKTVYVGSSQKITICCPVHGEFKQFAAEHLHGRGCSACFNDAHQLNGDEFMVKAKSKHGGKFDYSKTKFISTKKRVVIICPTHGEFEQVAGIHIYAGSGCPTCRESRGEKAIRMYLEGNGITFEREKQINIGRSLKFRLDFFLPEFNMAIEYHGTQHYYPSKHFGGTKRLVETKENDEMKQKFCCQNKIKLLTIKYDKLPLINEILNQNIKSC